MNGFDVIQSGNSCYNLMGQHLGNLCTSHPPAGAMNKYQRNKPRSSRIFAGGGRMPYKTGPREERYTIGRNPYRRGGGIRRFGHGAYLGSPNSCTDGMGNNVPC